MNEINITTPSNEFLTEHFDTNMETDRFTFEEPLLVEPAVMFSTVETPKVSEEPRVLRRSQRIKDQMERKRIQSMISDVEKDPEPRKSKSKRSTRRVSSTNGKCKCIKLASKYFECASINGRLYRLKDLTDAIKTGIALENLQQKSPKKSMGISRSRRPGQSKKKTKSPSVVDPEEIDENTTEMKDLTNAIETGTPLQRSHQKSPKKNLGTARSRRPGQTKKDTKNSIVVEPVEANENITELALETARSRRPRQPKKDTNNSMDVDPVESAENTTEMDEKYPNSTRKRYGLKDKSKDREYKPPSSYRAGKSNPDPTDMNDKPEPRRSERITNQKERLLMMSKKPDLENIENRRPQSSRSKKQESKLNSISGDMEVGIAIKNKQQKQQRKNQRQKLGTAGPNRLGKSKNSKRFQSVDPQNVVPPLRVAPVVDWEKIGVPKVVQEPQIVLRRSARIQEAKRRRELLEKNLKKDEEKPKPRKVPKPRKKLPKILGHQTCCKCKTKMTPKSFSTTYFECADINGRLYRLADLSEDMNVGMAFQRQQKKSQLQKSRRVLGTKEPLPKDLKRLNRKHK
ncbi:serine/arginine repetitive matrix protein 2 [Drosophila subpulchrella]|uniref:serine/arginine repetitive matrix protein 2 n=1 Tax=Drosophila subpulchrella TaxID=1486046 RepID=UPI0018A164BF|nr:serine/arginine repetitive matrix protein 2 [Drosophila subpulchrella]